MPKRPGTLTGLRRLAERTPPDRDRYVDFLRGLSIAVVVLGHWLIAVVTWEDGTIEGANALEVIPGLWVATWVLQVMPLFFFVGGFSNLLSLGAARRKGVGYAGFMHGRLIRMMRPTAVFLGIGVIVTATLDALNIADTVVFPVSELIARPLWFLGVYMIVVALSPAMAALHRRFGLSAVAGLAAIAVIVDLLRFGFDLSAVGYINYPIVWLLAHQLGFLYADGRLSKDVGRWMALGGLASMIALVNLGPYPGSMVGLSTDEFSNMDPPTVAILALTVWQVGVAMMLRERVSRWLARTGPWMGVAFANSVIMTMFLWHLTAMVVGIGILFPIGFPQPEAGTAAWWLLRPVWVAFLIVLLSGFVAVFGRFEQRGFGRPSPSPSAGSRASAIAAAVGTALVVVGVLGFAMGGMHQVFSVTGTELILFRMNPFLNVIHLILGGVFLWASVRDAPTVRWVSVGGAATLALLTVSAGLLMSRPYDNRLALNGPDLALHAILAISAAAAAITAARDSERVGNSA